MKKLSLLFISVICFLVGFAQKKLVGDKFVPVWDKNDRFISFARQREAPQKDSKPLTCLAYLIDTDGSGLREFFNKDAVICDIAKDGRVLYSVEHGNEHDLYSAYTDGRDEKQLTHKTGINVNACWSPDLTRISFLSNRDGQFEVYVMNANGTGQTNISRTPKANEGGRPPMWSPDGKKILFNSLVDGDWEVYEINADGSGLKKLTDNTVTDMNPSYSPDGKLIAYISNPKGSKDEQDHRIFIMNADGSNAHQVGDISPIHGSLSWSPRGDRLAFNAYGNMYFVEIFSIGIDGRGPKQLTFSPRQRLLETLKNKSVEAARKLFDKYKRKRTAAKSFAPVPLQRLANEYLRKKDYVKAIAAFTFLTETHSDNAGYWYRLGQAYKENGDKENAIRCLKQALTLNPANDIRASTVELLKDLGVSV